MNFFFLIKITVINDAHMTEIITDEKIALTSFNVNSEVNSNSVLLVQLK